MRSCESAIRVKPLETHSMKMGRSPSKLGCPLMTFMTFSAASQYLGSPLISERYFISSWTLAASAVEAIPRLSMSATPIDLPRLTLERGIPEGVSYVDRRRLPRSTACER